MARGRHVISRVAPVWIAAIICFIGGHASAQNRANPSPISRLRQLLASPAFGKHELVERQRSIQDQLGALTKPAELREALFVPEWRDGDPDTALAEWDRSLRTEAAQRLKRGLLDALRIDDSMTQLAAARMLSDWATATNASQRAEWRLHEFGPILTEIIQTGHATMREAAVLTLGRIAPDPALAGVAVGRMLRSEDVANRRAAAEALIILVSTTGLAGEIASESLPRTCRVVLPLAAHGLADRDVHVRRQCVEAFRQAALGAERMLTDEDVPTRAVEIRALADTINGRMIAFTAVLSDFDPVVRILAYQTLEIAAHLDHRLPKLCHVLPPHGFQQAQTVSTSDAKDYTEALPSNANASNSLHVTLPSLAGSVNDPESQVRRASLDVLESLGEKARPESSAIVTALRDNDLYVRWTAARTLGRLGPIHDESSVKGLAERLSDVDMDVRAAAAEALKRYGPAARDAIPALVQAINHSEPGTRVAAIRALEHIGPSSDVVMPALITALSAPEARVRQSAARFLGSLGPETRDAAPALRHALDDSAPGMRKAASDALLEIFPVPPHESPVVIGNDAIRQASYIERPIAEKRPPSEVTDRVIATTPGAPHKSSFATDVGSTQMQTPAWRPSAHIGPAAALLPPRAASQSTPVRATNR